MDNIDLEILNSFLDDLTGKSRANLLPSLLKAQSLFGYIPEEAASLISRKLNVPPADIYGVIEFYSLLYSRPVGDKIIRVCTSPLCSMKGSEKIRKALLEQLEFEDGTSVKDGRFVVESVQCLGMCDQAPAVMVGDVPVAAVSADDIEFLLGENPERKPATAVFSRHPVLTSLFGKVNPESVEDYINAGGFSGFTNALSLKKSEIIEAVKDSGLLGRGGAAFPAGIKEESVAGVVSSSTYLVCNADESEPGTFKDRVLLSSDPFSVVEGMLISAYAVGACKGYIYIRGEYSYVREIVEKAVAAAGNAGYLGQTIRGSGFSFDIEIRSGAGAYICGEETALFESIEGKRGYPRNKPPYPVHKGLFGQPTAINNVETFSYISKILKEVKKPAEESGSRSASGTRLFCLSGDILRPGLYELPFGTPLREVVLEWGGGPPSGDIQAIILGGASGSFVPEEYWDIPLDQKSLKEAGLTMGSGVIMVIGTGRKIINTLYDIASFFSHESCGKCYPCQLGTRFQKELIAGVLEKGPEADTWKKLEDIGMTMKDASLCGLGQTASSAMLSAMKQWPEYFTPSSDRGKS